MANVLNTDKQIAVIGALAEGSSIRSIERMTGIHRDTIMRLGVKIGQGCTAMMDAKMRNLPCSVLRWMRFGASSARKAQRSAKDDPRESVTFGRAARLTPKPSWSRPSRLGPRAAAANAFVRGRCKAGWHIGSRSPPMASRLTWTPSRTAFGADVDYGQIIKVYGTHDVRRKRRYSTPGIVPPKRRSIPGIPNLI